MNSHTTERFRKAFDELPNDVKEKAKQAFQLWKHDPIHPSLKFKQVHPSQSIYSARIGLGWRALGVKEHDVMIWFWIGSHADYDRVLSQM